MTAVIYAAWTIGLLVLLVSNIALNRLWRQNKINALENIARADALLDRIEAKP